jgi:nucleoside-diphosphate-sugar epimerase
MTGTVLITGASGTLGSELVPRLREHGWRVRALVHHKPVTGADETATGDLRVGETLPPALEGVVGVVHLAARTHARRAREYEEVNVLGTRALIGAARRAGVARIVYASTRAIGPPGGAYSRSKAEAEQVVRESGPEHSIVRLPELYGTGARLGVDAIVDRVRRGRLVPLVGAGDYELCPIPLRDAVEALAAALESAAAAGKTYTLGGECMSMRAFALRCATALDSPSRIVGVPVAAVALACRLAVFLPLPVYPDQLSRLRAPKSPLSPEAEEELHFRPPRLEEGLSRVTRAWS